MIRFKPVLLVCLLLVSSLAYSQSSNTSRKKALEIKNRILLVPVATRGPKKNRELFKELVKKYWTFNDKVEYVSATKVKSLMKKNKKKYALLTYSSFSETTMRRTRNLVYNGMNGKYNKDTYIANTIHTLMISLGKKADIKVNLSRNYSLERNTIYGLMHLQHLLNYLVADAKNKSLMTFYRRQIKKNAPELKTKTLLLDKGLLAKKLKISEIKKYYPYPYKIVDATVIDKALKEQNPDYAFIHIANLDIGRGAMNIHFISSTKGGKIYLYVAPKSGSISGINGIKFRQFYAIGKKQLKRYDKRLK